jgi:thiamine biosynthesis protein ThiI
MTGAPEPARLVATPSPDLHLKSKRTRRRLLQILGSRLGAAAGPDGDVRRVPGERFTALVHDPRRTPAVAERLATVFGIGRVDEVELVDGRSVASLTAGAVPRFSHEIAGRSFAVRVRRRGVRTGWSGPDAERTIGAALLAAAPDARVDLTHPDVMVRIEVLDGEGWMSTRRYDGPRGLPLGSGAPMLSLLSGGIDSPVAAWLMMRTGSPVHFVHFSLGCSGSDHAAAVASGLVRRWGTGTSPQLVVVPFEKIADALVATADPALRQIHLKQAMLNAAERIAARRGIELLLTGDAIGQVSSQTAANLSVIDRATKLLVLRPLAGMHKEEISSYARRIGTFDISTRAVERCDLSTGPVAIEARPARVQAGWEAFDHALLDAAVEDARRIVLRDWVPGDDGAPAWRAAE